MTNIAPLSRSYADARASFVAAANSAGAQLDAHPHPLTGPDDGELAVDVATIGDATANHTVLVVSATHGVEGYCGSALQSHWLASHAHQRPAGTRVVMIHALNPYGFAWVRRVNEDNVDLNRNFVDWSEPAPANPRYAEIADLLVPAAWTEAEQTDTTLQLLAVAERWGFDELQGAISGGQYTHPDGLFHGGSGPVWSHRWLRGWAAQHLRECERLTIIDLHSGLGPWGHGELIVHADVGSDEYRRAEAMWGDVRSMQAGESVSAVLQGDWLATTQQLAPRAEITAAALEFGTVDPVTVLQALRADAWLHAHGDPRGPGAADVAAQVRAAFADDDPTWIATLWDRFADVFGQALAVTG